MPPFLKAILAKVKAQLDKDPTSIKKAVDLLRGATFFLRADPTILTHIPGEWGATVASDPEGVLDILDDTLDNLEQHPKLFLALVAKLVK